MRRFGSRRALRPVAMTVAIAAIGVTAVACGSTGDSTSVKDAKGTGVTATVSSNAAGKVPASLGNPTPEALCKKASYKIGYENYSETQQFEAKVNKNMKDLAKRLGCVQLISLTDNGDGPTAVANVRTMINEGIQGLVNNQFDANSEPAIDKLVKKAGIPAVTSAVQGAPGIPYITVEHYPAGFALGNALGKAAKDRYPDEKAPYLVDAVFVKGGPTQIDQHRGTIAGVKKYYPDLPADHIIQVPHDTTGPVAYANTLSALSSVPPDALVLMTGTNSDAINGMYRAAKARKRKKFLVEDSSAGDIGLKNLCRYPEYSGSISFVPDKWGDWLLPAVMEQINGNKVPATVGIPTEPVTKETNPFC